MRSWLQAATLLLAAGSAFALPHPRHAGNDVATVAGSIGPDTVSIQFSTPCDECFLDTKDGVELELKVDASKHECDISGVYLNGRSLVPRGGGHFDKGNIAFTAKSVRQLSDVEVVASWSLTCLNNEISLLSVTLNNKIDEDESAKPSGFAVSFKQRKQPVLLRLQTQPIRDIVASDVHDEWVNVSPEFQLIVVPPSLEGEIRILEEIEVQIGQLVHQYVHQERRIAKMIKHDFQACHGIKCMLQTAMRKAPDAFALLKAHFHHPHQKAHDNSPTVEELPMHVDHGDMQDQDSPIEIYGSNGVGPQHDELEATAHPPPPPSEHEPPHDRPEHHGPPFGGERPRPPPPPEEHHKPHFGDERPHPPPAHHEPPSDGEHPPPPPPDHHGPPFGDKHPHGPPPFEGEHPHPPPPPDREPPHHKPEHHGPPSDDGNPHGPPHRGPPFGGLPHHGPPSDRHPFAAWDNSPGHHRPHFGRHGPHRQPLLVTIATILLLLIFTLAIAKVVRSKRDQLRKQRKRQNRLARCEERRNRVAYRCAAAQHRWSRWWSQFRQPQSTADYDEKRTRIVNQESHLEGVMQSEIRDLRRAHELVGEIMRAEQDRQRLYHEANFGSSRHNPIYEVGESSSASGSMGTSTLPEYQSPPPSYEAELEGEMSVVDGFRYTPSNTESTPDSSVVDCSSRISFETGSAGGLKDF